MDYKEFLNQIVKECNSKADLCRALDKKPTGGNYECPNCHKIFHQSRPEQKYCSTKCASEAHSHNICKEDLLKHIIELNGNFTQIGKVYGITDNAVRKWCDKFGFPRHKKDLLKYIKNLK